MHQNKIKELLDYNPETGVFTWIKAASKYASDVVGKIAGSTRKDGYIAIWINNKQYKAHRLAFLYMTGEMPSEVDHKNRNRNDNRWKNLRECTKSQNRMNTKIHKNNKSGVKGVHWHKAQKRWAAKIQANGEQIHLGYFEDINRAERARKEAENIYHGEYAA